MIYRLTYNRIFLNKFGARLLEVARAAFQTEAAGPHWLQVSEILAAIASADASPIRKVSISIGDSHVYSGRLLIYASIPLTLSLQFILEDILPEPPSQNGINGHTAAAVSKPPPLLLLLVKAIVQGNDSAAIEHLGDTLKVLLDCERMDKMERNKFLSLFYDHYVMLLSAPFLEPNNPCVPCAIHASAPVQQDLAALSTSRRLIFDTLCQCVIQHTYRMKYYIMRNGVLSRCLLLLDSPHRHLHLCAIKFIKAVVSIKEDFYLRHIVKFDILRPLFKLLDRACPTGRDDLVTSAILDLLEYLRTENIDELIRYIIEKFADCVDNAALDSIERLRVRYDQLIDKENTATAPQSDEARQSEGKLQSQRMSDLELEEAYLLDDGGVADEDKASMANPLSYLMENYSDDDDEDGAVDGPDASSEAPPLPPMRPKFEDDSLDSFFSRAHPPTTGVRRRDSGMHVEPTAPTTAAVVDSESPAAAADDAVGSLRPIVTVSFAVKKRKMLL